MRQPAALDAQAQVGLVGERKKHSSSGRRSAAPRGAGTGTLRRSSRTPALTRTATCRARAPPASSGARASGPGRGHSPRARAHWGAADGPAQLAVAGELAHAEHADVGAGRQLLDRVAKVALADLGVGVEQQRVTQNSGLELGVVGVREAAVSRVDDAGRRGSAPSTARGAVGRLVVDDDDVQLTRRHARRARSGRRRASAPRSWRRMTVERSARRGAEPFCLPISMKRARWALVAASVDARRRQLQGSFTMDRGDPVSSSRPCATRTTHIDTVRARRRRPDAAGHSTGSSSTTVGPTGALELLRAHEVPLVTVRGSAPKTCG